MQTHTSNGNEGKRPIPDHGLAVSDHVAAVPDHIEAVKTAGPATAGSWNAVDGYRKLEKCLWT